MDRDGLADICALDEGGELHIARGTGGGFTFPRTLMLRSSGQAPGQLEAGDLDGDGDLDFVVAFDRSCEFVILEQTAWLTFREQAADTAGSEEERFAFWRLGLSAGATRWTS